MHRRLLEAFSLGARSLAKNGRFTPTSLKDIFTPIWSEPFAEVFERMVRVEARLGAHHLQW